MKSRTLLTITIAWVCTIIVALGIFRYTSRLRERENFESGLSQVALPVALSGALPQSTIILNDLNSVKFFSEQNFQGSLLKAMQIGENSDKESLNAIRISQSIKIPENILLQIFGKGGQQVSLPGLAEVGTWETPDWEITRCVVYFSPMTGSSTGVQNMPEPVRDDWKESDRHVISAIESDVDLSNVPRFDIMSIYESK